jgi:hypothetical protein
MKKMIATSTLLVILSSAYADDNNYGYESNQSSSNNGYESTTGTKYQYDMSYPIDRVDYSVRGAEGIGGRVKFFAACLGWDAQNKLSQK